MDSEKEELRKLLGKAQEYLAILNGQQYLGHKPRLWRARFALEDQVARCFKLGILTVESRPQWQGPRMENFDA